jgi:hypothetical protein
MKNNSSHKTVCFFVTHSYDYALAVKLSRQIKSEGDFFVECIIASNSYLKKIDIDEKFFRMSFDNILFLSEDEVPKISKNLFRQLFNFYKCRLEIKRFIANRNLTLISFDKSTFLSHWLLSFSRRSILFQDRTMNYSANAYKLDFVLTIYYILFSFPKIRLVYKLRNANKIKFIKDYLRRITILHWDAVMIDDRSVTLRIETPRQESKKSRILYFGSHFFEWEWVDEEVISRFEKCCNAIKSNLGERSILYLERPGQTDKEFNFMKGIFGDKIALYKNAMSAELVLMNNTDIYGAISIGSTASRSAARLGIRSYVLYPKLRFPRMVEKTYDDIFNDGPSHTFLSFDIDVFFHMPPRYLLSNTQNLLALIK